MRDEPYEKILRDIRIFPIFEGANDVMRAFIALSGMKPLGEKLSELGEIGLDDPIGSIGVLVDYVGGADPARGAPGQDHPWPTPSSTRTPRPVSDQVKRAARRHRVAAAQAQQEIIERQFQQKRLADAISDIYAQIAVLSRVTPIFEDQGVEPSGQERYIAETFCTRAAASRALARSTRSSATTTSGCRRSPSSPTSAASTATRCSRTRAFAQAQGAPAPPLSSHPVRVELRSHVNRNSARAATGIRTASPAARRSSPCPGRRRRTSSPGRPGGRRSPSR